MNPASIIIRIGGVPVDTLAPFASGLGEYIDEIIAVAAQASELRPAVVAALHDHVPLCEGQERRLVLALKRDCHNGRFLCKEGRTEQVEDIAARIGPAFQTLIELENRISLLQRTFDLEYERQACAESTHLAQTSQDDALRCGIGLSSAVFYREMRSLPNVGVRQWGRNERRVSATLLRYLSRAAVKLSPLSTFTRVGLCHVIPGVQPPRIVGNWTNRSVVRARQHLLDRCTDLLLRVRRWRETLPLRLNDSVTQMDDGRILLRRPSFYEVTPTAEKIEFRHEALARMEWTDEASSFFAKDLAHRPRSYAEVIVRRARSLGHGTQTAEAEREVETLITAGVLQFVLPWTADESRTEEAIVRALSASTCADTLKPVIDILRQMMAAGDDLPTAADHGAAGARLDHLLTELLRVSAQLAGVPSNVDVSSRPSTQDIYQDVWCEPSAPQTAAFASVGHAGVAAAHRSIEPFIRAGSICSRHLDFRLALSALLRRTGQDGASVLSAFSTAQQLWREYTEYRNSGVVDSTDGQAFDPYQLDEIGSLQSVRSSLAECIRNCAIPDGDTLSADAGLLRAYLESVPASLQSPTGACVFLQPADTKGTLWVQNGIREGTGRSGSRYSILMDAQSRQEFTQNLAANSTVIAGEQPFDLLEVYCVNGDTLNIHAPQTSRVLVLPGDRTGIGSDRIVRLCDLVISAPAGKPAELRGRNGRRYLPVHLGLSSQRYMPSLVRFLCSFGPTDSPVMFPSRLSSHVDEHVTVSARTVAGNVVLHRKCWRVRSALFSAAYMADGAARAFQAVHRLRRRYNMPDRVFVGEQVRTATGATRVKPQFIDFTSPSFVSLLQGIAQSAPNDITFTEMVPDFEAFPKDAQGRTWAIELLADSIALPAQARAAA